MASSGVVTTSAAQGPHRSKAKPSARHPVSPTTYPHARTGIARELSHGPRNSGQVALTFHGAGDIALCRSILQIAETRDAKITVLAVGTWLAQNPGIGRTILAQGHELGNHTWSHLDIDSMPEDQMRSEVVRCRDALVKDADTPGTFFRQSQARRATARMRRVAGGAGYAFCLSYDVDSMDWTDPGVAAIRRNLKDARSGSIVSMHLGHPGTVEALPGVLDDLSSRKLTPVTASSLLGK